MATPDFIKAPVALINNLLLPHPEAPQVDLSGKVFIVTGATPGSIGYESALTFIAWGAKVYVTARTAENTERCVQALKDDCAGADSFKNNVFGHALDLQSSESVSAFVNWFKQHSNRLDVLVNNAGIFLDVLGQWSEPHLSEDGHELHWRINYLGALQLTCELLPLLRKTAKQQGEARIVNVSSHMHDNCNNDEMFSGLAPYKSVKAYGRSKLAINHLTFFLHKKLFTTQNVKCICLHPGSIYTNLVEKGLAGNPTLLTVRAKLAWIEKLILLNPIEGAQTQILCATTHDIKSGAYYRRCKVEKYSPSLDEPEAAERLWQQSLVWLKSVNSDIDIHF